MPQRTQGDRNIENMMLNFERIVRAHKSLCEDADKDGKDHDFLNGLSSAIESVNAISKQKRKPIERNILLKIALDQAKQQLAGILAKKPDTLYCSFCRLSQHEVNILIAAETVFICDECVELSSEILEERNGKRKITRSLEFNPPHRQAGIAILSYFARYLSERYPNVEAQVQIQQERDLVRMVIETTEGQREIVERTLEEYALVSTGRLDPEERIQSALAIIELKHQLEAAHMQLRWAERHYNLLEDQNRILLGLQSRQADHFEDMNKTLRLGLTQTGELARVIRSLASSRTNSVVQISLNRILDLVESGLTAENESEARKHLRVITEHDPPALREMYDFCKDTASGAAGSLLANWIGPIAAILPS